MDLEGCEIRIAETLAQLRAAMIYQHATRDRDQAIAKALGTFVRDARGTKEGTPEAPERGEQGA